MKRLIGFSAILLFLAGIISCNNDDGMVSSTGDLTFKATLNGANEVPTNASAATGNATLIYYPSTKTFTLTITHNVMSATAAHVHKGEVGSPGPPVFALTSLTSPITFNSVALNATQEADLKANLYYVNFHTAAYPDGEIRGQLLKQTSSGGGGGGY